MALVPTFATPPGFLGIERRDPGAAFTVAGIPLDIGTTNRAGARDGPSAIRRASRMLVDGAHPHHWIEPAASMDIADAGDFAIVLGDLAASLAAIEAQAAPLRHLVALGGEHGITLPLLRALRKRIGEPLGLVQFDSHLDTWPENFGQRLAHGSVFYHALDEGLVDPRRMGAGGHPLAHGPGRARLDPGARRYHHRRAGGAGDRPGRRSRGASGTCWAKVRPTSPSTSTRSTPPTRPAPARRRWAASPPGRCRPSCGGLDGLGFAGMDVVEVAPAHDVAEITSLAAATVAWEYLALLGAERGA